VSFTKDVDSDFGVIADPFNVDLPSDFRVCHQVTVDGDFLVLQRDAIPIDLDGDFRVQGTLIALDLDGDFVTRKFSGSLPLRSRRRRAAA
jgi:hypothetical protein